jgi:hypothetical protein
MTVRKKILTWNDVTLMLVKTDKINDRPVCSFTVSYVESVKAIRLFFTERRQMKADVNVAVTANKVQS